MQTSAQIDVTAMSLAATAGPSAVLASTNGHGARVQVAEPCVIDTAGDRVDDDRAPTDEEEFASPPPPVDYTPGEPTSR